VTNRPVRRASAAFAAQSDICRAIRQGTYCARPVCEVLKVNVQFCFLRVVPTGHERLKGESVHFNTPWRGLAKRGGGAEWIVGARTLAF
jgi:hypothetical protein